MRNKHCLLLVVLSFSLLWGISAQAQPFLQVTGAVRQPLNLSIEDLERYQSIQVQLNEVMKDGTYRGAFYYKGVPLRTILETAAVRKEGATFSKNVDLAIRVSNKQGRKVALSWGEVFYRNPGRIVLATSAVPIIPHKDCSACHSPDVYKPCLDQLHRKIGFPKLVLTGDTYADRSLEEITAIEVLDLRPQMPSEKMEKLFSPAFTVQGSNVKAIRFTDLPDLARISLKVGRDFGIQLQAETQSSAFSPRFHDLPDILNQEILVGQH